MKADSDNNGNSIKNGYRRPGYVQLPARLHEQRQSIQVVAGPQEVDKTTILRQVLESIDQPVTYADEQNLKGSHWIAQQWDAARLVARQSKHYYREGTHVALQL